MDEKETGSTKVTNMRTHAAILVLFVAASLLFSCHDKEKAQETERKKPTGPLVKLAYVEQWSSETASTNLVKAVLREKLGYRCDLMAMSPKQMWEAVAAGRADAMVSAWLPGTHEHYYREYKDRVDDLGPNLEGTRIGLLVPDVSVGRQTGGSGQHNEPYIKADSIAELPEYAQEFRHRIVGIGPDAGIMRKTRHALKAYGLEDDFRLVEGSEQSMTREITEAVSKQEWIVVTGWYPHWMFGRWKLKFLEDPKNVYGDKEHINTIVRKGLKQDMPEVYTFLDNFRWTSEQMAHLMLWIKQTDGLYPYEQALRWLRTHPERVEEWLPKKSQEKE